MQCALEVAHCAAVQADQTNPGAMQPLWPCGHRDPVLMWGAGAASDQRWAVLLAAYPQHCHAHPVVYFEPSPGRIFLPSPAVLASPWRPQQPPERPSEPPQLPLPVAWPWPWQRWQRAPLLLSGLRHAALLPRPLPGASGPIQPEILPREVSAQPSPLLVTAACLTCRQA